MCIDLKKYGKKTVQLHDVYVIKDAEELYKPHLKLSCPDVVSVYLHQLYKSIDFNKEHFVSLSLNVKNELIAANLISIGNLNSGIVHPREVFYSAIVDLAYCVVLCHNHPSGDMHPSQNDIDLTNKLNESGRILGIPVLDHIILGDKWNYYSFKENNYL